MFSIRYAKNDASAPTPDSGGDPRRAGAVAVFIPGMDEQALRELPQVRSAFTEARDQLRHYRAALLKKFGQQIPLRSYAVVAVGLERLLGEETPAAAPPESRYEPPTAASAESTSRGSA